MVNAPLAPVQSSQDDPAPMHIFDIRRSNSVTELWKRYELQGLQSSRICEKEDTSASTEPTARMAATSYPGEDDQPLLAAFEVELANIMNSSTETPSETRAPHSGAETAPGPSRADEQGPHYAHPGAAEFLKTRLQNILNEASRIEADLASKWPGLQNELRDVQENVRRQLHDAQRNIPENFIPFLQAMIASIEAQIKTAEASVKTAYDRIPDNGLRDVADILNTLGQNIFKSFESKFTPFTAPEVNTTTIGNNQPSGVPPDATAGVNLFPHGIPSTENPASNMDSKEIKSEVPEAAQTTSQGPNIHDSAQTPNMKDQDYSRQENLPYPSNPGHLSHFNFSPPLFAPSQPSVFPPRPSRSTKPHGDRPHWMAPPPTEPLSSGSYHYPYGYGPGRFPHAPPPPPPMNLPPPGSGGWPFGHAGSYYLPPSLNMSPERTSQNDLGAMNGFKNTNQSGEEPSPDNKTLFIGNIGFDVTEQTIKDVFAAKGFIVTVDLPVDSISSKHAGFGYLQFPSSYAAMAAMQSLQGTHIDGHAINLELSHTAANENIAQATTNVTDQNLSGPQSLISDGPNLVPSKTTSIKRRKSVTFQEPTRPESNNLLSGMEDTKQESHLLDQAPVPNDWDKFEAPLPNPFVAHGLEDLPSPSPEAQISRFPPVSMFEAQVLANQQKPRKFRAGPEPLINEVQKSQILSSESSIQDTSTREESSHPIPDFNLRRSNTTPFATRSGPSSQEDQVHALPGIRRVNTTSWPSSLTEAKPSRQVSGSASTSDNTASRLRRRATERASPRVSDGLDTWARLDKRERSRSRPRSMQSIPGSFPNENQTEPNMTDSRGNDEIDTCVDRLVNMGYGTAQEGGRARMAVYAAASNGNLLDAIEMIEDERKAYAQHPR